MTRSFVLRAMTQMVDTGPPLAVIVVAGAVGNTAGIQLANEEQLTLDELLTAWQAQRKYADERLLLLMVHPGAASWVDKLAATPLHRRQGVAVQALDIPVGEEKAVAAAVQAWVTVAWGWLPGGPAAGADAWSAARAADAQLERCRALHCWWGARTPQPGIGRPLMPSRGSLASTTSRLSFGSAGQSSMSLRGSCDVYGAPQRMSVDADTGVLADFFRSDAKSSIHDGHFLAGHFLADVSLMDLTISLAMMPQVAEESAATCEDGGERAAPEALLAQDSCSVKELLMHPQVAGVAAAHRDTSSFSISTVTCSSIQLSPSPYAHTTSEGCAAHEHAVPDTPCIGKTGPLTLTISKGQQPQLLPTEEEAEQALPTIKVTAPVSRYASSNLDLLVTGGTSNDGSFAGAVRHVVASSPRTRRLDSSLSDPDLQALLPLDSTALSGPNATSEMSSENNLQVKLFLDAMGSDNPNLAPPSAAAAPGGVSSTRLSFSRSAGMRHAATGPSAVRSSAAVPVNDSVRRPTKYYYPNSQDGAPRNATPPDRGSFAGLVPLRLSPACTLSMLQSLGSASGQPVAAHASPMLMACLLGSRATPPAPRRGGRSAWCGDEPLDVLFADEAARWRAMRRKVEDDCDLLAELEALCPMWCSIEGPRDLDAPQRASVGAGAGPHAHDAPAPSSPASAYNDVAPVSLLSLVVQQAQAGASTVCDAERGRRDASELSMLALMQATSTRHGPSLAQVASYRLMLRMLADDTPTASVDGASVRPAGRTQLRGEERGDEVFADDHERWAHLRALVHGDAALEHELRQLMPPAVTIV